MKKVVYTPGVWDLLHIGHLNLIRRAKEYGDRLVVGVCSDNVTEQTKGQAPTIKEHHRAELIASIRYVDQAYIYTDLDHSTQLSFFGVSIFVIGEEFGNQGIPEHAVALDFCRTKDIEVVRLPRFKGISTTDIINTLK